VTTIKTYSRRSFLGGACATVGALVLPSVVSPFGGEALAAERAPGRSPFSLGVLYPESGLAPRVGGSLLAGLALHLGPGVSLRSYGVRGTGEALEKARELVSGGTTLAVALAAGDTTAALDGFFEEEGGVCVGLDVGANVLRDGDAAARCVHSLGLWRGAAAMGEWAARNAGGRAVLATHFSDSGYDAPYAFRLGFEEAGGEVVKSSVTHVPPGRTDLASLMREISALRPDFVYASYGGSAATEFVRAYAASGLNKKVALLGHGFLADEALLKGQGSAALGVKTFGAWSPALDSRENSGFKKAYGRKTGRVPDVFAVLGYEVGRMIQSALDAVGGDPGDDGLASALENVSVTGPRGPVSMNADPPLHLREVRKKDGILRNSVISKLEEPTSATGVADLKASIKTGWLETYLGR